MLPDQSHPTHAGGASPCPYTTTHMPAKHYLLHPQCLFAAALLAGSSWTAWAGQSLDKVVVAPVPANPLCFLDGKLCFDVQERMRFEARNNNFDFNDSINAPTDDSWLLNRFRLGVTYKPVSWLKFYAQGQDSREFDSDRPNIPGALGAEGDDAFDLRQAYVEFSDFSQFPLGVKVGRQILSYGDERLIGAFDWNNFGRTFDAVKVRYQTPLWSVDLFSGTPVVISRDEFNQSDLFNGTELDRDLVFSGIHFSTDAAPWGTYEAYTYLLDQESGVVTNTQGSLGAKVFTGSKLDRSDFVTVGMRVKGDPKKLHGFEFDAEANYQAGTVRGLDLNAFAAHFGAGYNFNAPWKPRLWLDYAYASGDSNPADGEIGTFQNLFPTNHKFYGLMDLTSMQNMHHLSTSFRVAPTKSVTVQIDYHAFFAASTDDVWYRANGLSAVRPLSPAARSASNYEGSEVDLVATWNVNKNFQLQGGYAHFFAGEYLSDTGPSDDADFGYVQATITF